MGFLDFLQAGTLSGTIKHFVNSYYKYSTLAHERIGEHSKSEIFVTILYERNIAAKQIGNSQYYDALDIDKFIDYTQEDFAIFIMFLLMLDSKSYRKAFKHDSEGYYRKINDLLYTNGYNKAVYKKPMGAFSLGSFFYLTFKTYGV